MADEQAGKRMNFQVWWLSSLLTWGWKTQQTQQTQQTWSTAQTGAVQQQKTTPFLPWISDNAELQAKNKVSTNNGFIQWIQSWNIKTNIQLPWITTKPVEENTATLSPTTDKQKRQSYIYASNNNINTKSTAEQIEEERTSTWKVLWQIDNVWKTYVKAPINNYKKRWFRAIWDSWLTQNFIKKTLEKDWINLSDNTMESIDNIWQHIVQAYTDKINEDFRKLEEKNLDPKIKEKYDNSTIADLIWQGDFAGAFYKMNKWTAENWQMIPEIWLMFVSWPAWLAVMGADVYVQENQWTFEDMINNGATYEEARNWAIVVWIVNAGIELLSERLLWWAKWAGATAFRRLFLKEVQHEVVKTATKKWMAEIFSNWIKEIIKWSLVEWFEEVLQQIVWNAMVRTVNPDRELTEWSYEAFEWGFFNLFNLIWWWVNMVNEYQSNKQITKNADIEALKYVAEWEQRKAQRIQAKERLKARFMKNEMNPTMDNGYTPTQEEAQQRATENEERQQFEQERDEEYKREMQIEEDMINEVLSEWDLNEDLWDPRYQKSDSPQSASESTVSEKSRTWNIKISPENSSEISKNLNEIKKNLDNLKADTFLQQIKKSILWNEKSSNYITNRINNQKYTLRVSDHNTNAGTSIQHPNNNTSIVIKLASKSKFKKSKNVDMLEFVYDPNTMNTEIMQWIIDWIQNWLQTGKYTDTHYSDMKQSTRVKGQQQSGEKHQLKYEDKDYTPWVANKNEKDISWKEWLNLRNKLNKETVKQLAEKYWIKVEVIEWMIEILEKGIKKWYAYGKYVDDLLTLSEQIKESTAPHELLHAIFDMIDPETKTYLISQVMQSEWWTAEQSEEWLADSFSNFFRTGKIEWAPKSTRWKIKMFFKRVRSFVNGMNKWRNELEEIFTDIIDAKGIEDLQSRINQNEKITKAKEKMKKRFMEYEKNAEKMQKKADKSKEKYQTVYHWSPYDFEKFDSANMWKWEWAQAHGWGHYVAAEEKTWRHYAELRQMKPIIKYKWEPWSNINYAIDGKNYWLFELYREMNYYAQKWEDVNFSTIKEQTLSNLEREKNFTEKYINEINEREIARKQVKKYLTPNDKKQREVFRNNLNRYNDAIDAIKETTEKDWEVDKDSHHLYEVEIPDPIKKDTPTGSNYWEENRKLTNDEFEKIISELYKQDEKAARIALDIYGTKEAFLADGRHIYKLLADAMSPKEASKFLESLWYDGIHYFWGRDWEAYVIFNDNALEITNHEKYQKANSDQKDNEWRTLSNGQVEHNKNSKIRDKKGNLLRVYHGTNSEYTVYDSSLLWASSWDLWFFWDGWYFATHKWEARYYGRNVMEWYLNITNPFYYGNMTKIGNSDFGNNVYVTIRNLWKIDESINNREIDWYKVSEIWNMVDDYLKNVKLEKLNDAKDPYNGWDITYWKVTEYWKSKIKTAMKWLSENGMLDEQLNHYMMDKVWYLKPRDLIEEMTDDARFDKSKKSFSQILQDKWYDGIVVWDTAYETDEIVAFYSNQFKNINNKNPTGNDDIRYQRVYHWSPNAFDKFDSTHMGEWEGNQAHGRWHYVAVDPKTARTYAQEKFYKNEIEVKWRTMSRVDEVRDIPYALRSLYRDLFNTFAMWYYDVEEEAQNVIDRAKKEYEQTVEYYEKQIRENVKPPVEWVDMEALQADRKKYLAEFKEALEFIEELTPEDVQVREINDRRNFYEVEIPDPVKADTPTWSNYIEEQKKITLKQRKDLIKRLRNIKKDDEHFQAWVNFLENKLYASQFKADDTWKNVYEYFDEWLLYRAREVSEALQAIGYDWIHYDWQRDGECYVIFNDDDLEIKNHEKYQKAEYEYDENGNPKWLKFEEDNNEFDPSIFDWSREDQIESDKESEKNNAFYNAWIRYNNQNYKDDQLTFDEFIQWISKRAEKEQEIYDEKMKSLADSQNDPKLLELQLKAVKLMEKEQRVGKNPNGKNVSKEVRERQQKEVETERENLAKEIFDYMYPWLKFEDQTYDDQKTARDKEAEREMMGRQEIEEKLKLYKKDKNGNREAKDIKIDNPDIKLDKILSSWKFDEIFEPLDRVIEWKTPQGQKGRIDNQKDPKKYKSVMEKINSWKSKTKVTLKDVTQEARALEKYKAEQEAEKERKKKERQEAFAKKKQEEYKKNVRLKAFQKLVDMQRFEKYTFLTEDEIKKRRWFSDEERKKITEQQDINFPPKKRWENAIRDFNKAVDSEVKFIIEWLDWQNKMKRKEAEKNLWEIWDIDIDVLLWKDEEKWQKEVEEFEKIAKEEKKKSKKEKNKRLEQAREDVTKVDIDTERENNKSEKKKIDKLIKSTKTDKTVRWSVKQFTSDIVTPVSTKIRNISKKIHMEVMRYFQEKDIKTNTRLKEIDPFLKAMWKIRKDNPVRFMDIWVALANRNIWYANWLLEEYWVKVPTRLLDEIFDEAEDVGLNINYLWSYYPLSVKAPKSFLEELMKVDKWDIASEIEKRIMQESQKKWWPLEESEITAIINEVIAWEDKWPDVNTGNKHLKKRNTEIKWTPKMLEYCDDPISTLISYIEWMTQSIERAKFLGKSRSWNVHTLADYVYNAKNGLSPEQQDELMDLLKAVFNDASPNKFVQTWRDIATLTTLWSPSSTLTQLWDLSFSVYENGWKETLKAVRDIWCKNKAFNLQDMWVVNRWEEYTNINSQKNLLQKAIHNVFKLTFFSTFDTFWKSTFIQSTWKKRQKRAKMWEKWDKQLRKDIMKWTDDEYMTDKIINDLKKWVFSQDVALLMYMKLSNIQPLTKAQMPKAYLNNPNWRLFYQFKTFGIKQLDYVLQETKEQTKDFKNLSTTDKMLKIAQIANMVFIMTLLWVWADELKDLTMRRKSNSLILRRLFGEEVWAEQIWEKMEDNVLKLFWLSRYTVMQMKNDPVDAITSLFTTLPATNIINYPFKDIYKAFKDDGSINWRNPASYQLIPIIWKYRYWIYWGGQDKQQEALWKWKKKKKWWSGGWLRGKV